eukprot:scaffold93591_cov49-Attheya_sp.AAC.3
MLAATTTGTEGTTTACAEPAIPDPSTPAVPPLCYQPLPPQFCLLVLGHHRQSDDAIDGSEVGDECQTGYLPKTKDGILDGLKM